MHSRHALSLNLLFSEFQLNIDSEFYVSSIDETTGDVVDTLGPFTYENNKAHLHFAVAPLAGNTLLLELFVGPEGQDTLPLLRIESIVHGYKDTWMTTRKVSSGSCNINVVCKDGDEWAKEVRAVGMLMTGSGQGFCSGTVWIVYVVYCFMVVNDGFRIHDQQLSQGWSSIVFECATLW